MKQFLPRFSVTLLCELCLVISLLATAIPARAQLLAQNVLQTPSWQPETYRLTDIILQLKDKYHVNIIFEDRVLRNLSVTSEAARPQVTLEASLKALLSPFGLRYRKMKNNYLILSGDSDTKKHSTRTDPPPVKSQVATDQAEQPVPADLSISGTVNDENGLPMPGVSVLVKGTTQGTTTDVKGQFRLDVPDANTLLVFSFIGYSVQEVLVGNQTVFTIKMITDIKSLNEVVVVGYSTQQRRDITGAVATVDAKDLNAVPATNFAQQLQGRVAGVQVGTDGQPGGEVSVRIRGIGSITGSSDPLYIIDGVPTQGGLNQLNPNDIENLQVLKDAASASIYGARASNGVVIITTKRGKGGKTQVSLDAYTGFQQIDKSRIPKFITLQQAADLDWINARATGNVDPVTGNPVSQVYGNGATPVIPDYIVSPGIGVKAGDPRADPSKYDPINNPIAKVNTDVYDAWYRELYRSAPITSINLSVSGSSEKGRYALTAGYFDQQGILKYTGFKRYSLRVNTEFNVGKFIRIGENLQFSYTDNVKIGRYDENSPISPLSASFFQPIFDIAGNYTGSRQGNFYGNPYAILERNKDNHGYSGRMFGNVYAEADVLPGLTARTTFGLDYTNYNQSTFQPGAPESRLASQVAILDVYNNYGLNWVWTNTLNYSITLAGRHRISVLGGTEAVNNKFRSFGATKSDFAFNDLTYRTLDAAEKTRSASGGGQDSDSRLFSLFAKVNYAFDDKYLFSATVRRDGSSRFAPSYRYGVFPALSVGWRISQEAFMKDLIFIDDLKLRASWGKTGNQEINAYNQYSTYATSLASTAYDINGTSNSLVSGYAARKVGNPNAQWEAQTMTNVGIDATLFKGKINLTIDAYKRISDKLLLNIPHPGTDGQQQFPAVNVGASENKGIDVLVGYNGSGMKGQLKYGITANWSTYSNKVTALYAGDDAYIGGAYDSHFGVSTRTAVGHPISSFFGYQIDGIFQTQEEADKAPVQNGDAKLYNQVGRWRYHDVNGDGVIDAKDQTFIGSPIPKFTYGLNLTASYKGFDATLFLQGVKGNDIFNVLVLTTPSVRILDYWTPTNRNATLPAINSLASALEQQASSYEVEKGSYLRAKNIQIGYTLPAAITSKLWISRFRVYLQSSNLFTITKYRGLDPEINVRYQGGGADLTTGVDRGVYPLAQTFMAGIQLGF